MEMNFHSSIGRRSRARDVTITREDGTVYTLRAAMPSFAILAISTPLPLYFVRSVVSRTYAPYIHRSAPFPAGKPSRRPVALLIVHNEIATELPIKRVRYRLASYCERHIV